MDLVDRVCHHGYVYCPKGCHDVIPYAPANHGVHLMLMSIEDLSHGCIDPFILEPNLATMFDGIDEFTALAVGLMEDEEAGHGR